MKTNQELISKRYSEALFDVAVEQDKLQEVYDELQALSSILNEVPEIGDALTQASLTEEDKQKLFSELSEPFSDLVKNTLKVVYKNRRMNELPLIIEMFSHLYDEKQGFIKGNVTSVVPLSDEQITKLEKEVARLLGYNNVKLVNDCDKKIVGGLIINVNNQVIDRSLRSRLNKLGQSLMEV